MCKTSANAQLFRFDVKHELTHIYFSCFSVKLFISVVLLFGSQQMVRDMMLQAYDAGQ